MSSENTSCTGGIRQSCLLEVFGLLARSMEEVVQWFTTWLGLRTDRRSGGSKVYQSSLPNLYNALLTEHWGWKIKIKMHACIEVSWSKESRTGKLNFHFGLLYFLLWILWLGWAINKDGFVNWMNLSFLGEVLRSGMVELAKVSVNRGNKSWDGCCWWARASTLREGVS